MLAESDPTILSRNSEKLSPKKVTRIDKNIAKEIDWATNNEAFLSSLAPIALPIRALVPAWTPTATAIAIK